LRSQFDRNPNSRSLKQNLAGAIGNLNVMKTVGGFDFDEGDIRLSNRLAQELVDEDPAVIQNKLLLCNSLRTAAVHFMNKEDMATAHGHAKRGLDIVRQVLEQTNDLRAKATSHSLYEISGKVNYKLENYDAAKTDWQSSLECIIGEHESQVPRVKISIACAQLHLGDIEAANVTISQIDKQNLNEHARKALASWYCIRAEQAEDEESKNLELNKAVAILTSQAMKKLWQNPKQLKSIREFSGDWKPLQGNPAIVQLFEDFSSCVRKLSVFSLVVRGISARPL
jgi:predicted transcriptional regulator